MDQNGPNLAPPSFHATRISIFLENCSSQTTCVCLREERDILRSKRHAASPSSVILFDGWIFVKKAHVITVVSPDKYVQSFCLACDRFGDGDVCHSKKEICSFYALYIIGGIWTTSSRTKEWSLVFILVLFVMWKLCAETYNV